MEANPLQEPWPSEWLRGVLELCVLQVLASGPTYGYAIASRLEELGLGTVKGGTLYPLLGRLEGAGLVATEWRAGEGGPGRKYFALTGTGHTRLASRLAQWQAFSDVTDRVLAASPRTADPATDPTDRPTPEDT